MLAGGPELPPAGAVPPGPAILDDLSTSFGDTVWRLSGHVAANPGAYRADADRVTVSDFDSGRALGTTTAGSYRHQCAELRISRWMLRKCRSEAAAIRLVMHARNVMSAMRAIAGDIKRKGGGARLHTLSD